MRQFAFAGKADQLDRYPLAIREEGAGDAQFRDLGDDRIAPPATCDKNEMPASMSATKIAM
ncbi:hypothetical protein ACFSTD_07085 [Novosphingobium colocasiae]